MIRETLTYGHSHKQTPTIKHTRHVKQSHILIYMYKHKTHTHADTKQHEENYGKCQMKVGIGVKVWKNIFLDYIFLQVLEKLLKNV